MAFTYRFSGSRRTWVASLSLLDIYVLSYPCLGLQIVSMYIFHIFLPDLTISNIICKDIA
jgi:hypothetical protein